MYRSIKEYKNGHQEKSLFFKNKKGKLITGENKILFRWKNFFQEWLGFKNKKFYKAEFVEIEETEEYERAPTEEAKSKTGRNRELKHTKSWIFYAYRKVTLRRPLESLFERIISADVVATGKI